MTDLEFIVFNLNSRCPYFSARAASSFGFADLYSQDPDLQLERYPESFVSVYLLQLYFVLFSPVWLLLLRGASDISVTMWSRWSQLAHLRPKGRGNAVFRHNNPHRWTGPDDPRLVCALA